MRSQTLQKIVDDVDSLLEIAWVQHDTSQFYGPWFRNLDKNNDKDMSKIHIYRKIIDLMHI